MLAGFWLTVCAGLAMVVTYQLATGFPSAPTVTAAPPGAPLLDPVERPAPPRPPAADAVEQITARRLFPERQRPYAPLSTPADETAELAHAGPRCSWLPADHRHSCAGEGLMEGLGIEAIEQDRVQLRKDRQQQVLQLRADIPVSKTTRLIVWAQAAGDDATSRGLDSESVDEEAAPPE